MSVCFVNALTGDSDDCGADVNAHLELARALMRRRRPLFAASRAGCRGAVRRLLLANADPNCLALLAAAKNGHEQIIRDLLAAGADSNERDAGGATPLIAASQEGQLRIVCDLLAAGADPNLADDQGATPLHAGCEFGDTAVIEALLGANADPSRTMSTDGCTPLFMASQNNHWKTVQRLLSANAHPDTPRDNGCTPLYYATQQSYARVVEILLEGGADACGRAGHTPPILTVRQLGIAQRLLAYGADQEAPFTNGDTAIAMAESHAADGVGRWLAAVRGHTAIEICASVPFLYRLRALLRGGAYSERLVRIAAPDAAALCAEAGRPWSRSRHFLYPPATRTAVRLLLRCALRAPALPQICWLLVMANINRI
jgi:ankyrin repeat protein